MVGPRASANQVAARSRVVAKLPRRRWPRLRMSALVAPCPGRRGRDARHGACCSGLAAISGRPPESAHQVSEQLGLIWPHWHERALSEVDKFVSADLRRQRASDSDLRTHPAVNDLVRETYAAMIDLVRDSEDNCVLRKLDGLRAGFEAASTIFECAMRDVDEEVRRIRSQAAAEIVRAEAMIAHIADQDGGTSHDSTRLGSRSLWKPRSITAAPPTADARDLEAIRNSLFFNSAHYLEANPDVRAAGLTPRSTTSFTEAGKAETLGHFSRPGPISPDTPTSPNRLQRPLALRNAWTPRKPNSGGLAGALAEARVLQRQGLSNGGANGSRRRAAAFANAIWRLTL